MELEEKNSYFSEQLQRLPLKGASYFELGTIKVISIVIGDNRLSDKAVFILTNSRKDEKERIRIKTDSFVRIFLHGIAPF